jgi:hypothetical protein
MAYRFSVLLISRVPSTSRLPLYLGGGLGVASLVSSLFATEGPILCPFRRCTGGYCPGCGGTRAAIALVRGDVSQAWALHPWVVLLAVQSMVMSVAALAGSRSVVAPLVRPLVMFNIVIGVMIWATRIGVGAIPPPFL